MLDDELNGGDDGDARALPESTQIAKKEDGWLDLAGRCDRGG